MAVLDRAGVLGIFLRPAPAQDDQGRHPWVIHFLVTQGKTDEALSLAGNVSNVTVQWCLIAEGLNHSKHAKDATYAEDKLLQPKMEQIEPIQLNTAGFREMKNVFVAVVYEPVGVDWLVVPDGQVARQARRGAGRLLVDRD